MSFNKIESINNLSHNFKNLLKLKVLKLNNNKLCCLPKEIYLLNLDTLLFHNNNINIMSNTFEDIIIQKT